MKRIFLLFLLFLGLTSCGKDDDSENGEPVFISTTDLIVTIDENPAPGQVLGTVSGNSNGGDVRFEITEQNPSGAMEIDAASGELTVFDAMGFDFEANSSVTAIVRVYVEDIIEDFANVTINLRDVDESGGGNPGTFTIWDGPSITFTKNDNADFTNEGNQDRITDNVWLTRGDSRGIFNIRSESQYQKQSSPAGTEWSFGTTDQIDQLTFEDWETAVGKNPPGSVNRPMVLHLIQEDIYINITFTSWSQRNGGGMVYQRSTE
jgi:hypothetical protein